MYSKRETKLNECMYLPNTNTQLDPKQIVTHYLNIKSKMSLGWQHTHQCLVYKCQKPHCNNGSIYSRSIKSIYNQEEKGTRAHTEWRTLQFIKFEIKQERKHYNYCFYKYNQSSRK